MVPTLARTLISKDFKKARTLISKDFEKARTLKKQEKHEVLLRKK